MTVRDERLTVHVSRHVALIYRQAVGEQRGTDLEWPAAIVELERLASSAELVTDQVDGPDVWLAHDGERDLGAVLRAVRWRRHLALVSLRLSDGPPPLLDAEWTHEAQDGRPGPVCQLLAAYAAPVDVAVSPEAWRARSSLDGLDASLMVQRVDREGTPLIVAAELHRRRAARGRRGRR